MLHFLKPSYCYKRNSVSPDATQEHLHDVFSEGGDMEQGCTQQGFMEQGYDHLVDMEEQVEKVPFADSNYE